MEKKTFSVVSSDGSNNYHVNFELGIEGLKIWCDCKAGVLGQNCKHKDSLVDGSASLLVDRDQASELGEVARWVRESKVGQARDLILISEDELEQLQKKVKALKKSFSKLIAPTK